MKILVIFTGGTIGSVISDDWIVPDCGANYVLLDKYRSATNDNITQFDLSSPCNILSENLSARELNKIIEAVCNNLNKDYDGIIVTHGTDTLQYTAAALSYAVSGSKIPVLLVSSDYPLSDIRANGTEHFLAAVEFIRAKAGEGVFVPHKNDNEEKITFHIPECLASHGETASRLYSIGEEYAWYDGGVILNSDCKLNTDKEGVGKAEYMDMPQILTVNQTPCDSYLYSLDNVNAVILRPYHSGTLNTANQSLREFCKRAEEKEIPVFMVNGISDKNYESTKYFKNMGITALPNSAYPAVFVKCWLGISMGKELNIFVK